MSAVPGFDRHAAVRAAAHDARAYGRPLEQLIAEALEAAADIGVRSRLAANALSRRDDLEPHEAIASALSAADLLASAAWQQLATARWSVQQRMGGPMKHAPCSENYERSGPPGDATAGTLSAGLSRFSAQRRRSLDECSVKACAVPMILGGSGSVCAA